MYGLFMMLNPLYLVMMLPALVLAVWAQAKVKGAFAKWSQVATRRGYSGAEAAQAILDRNNIRDVKIEVTQGWLSDHYDPRSRTLRLSPNVYGGRSVAAVGIAAHEVGHAIQHARGYAALSLRSLILPVATLGSHLAFPLLFLGFIINSLSLVQFGIVVFSGAVLFQIVTLPVEFNASSRAKAALTDAGIVTTSEESRGVRKVLGAAAMTYVAAALAAVVQLLYFILRAGGMGGDD